MNANKSATTPLVPTSVIAVLGMLSIVMEELAEVANISAQTKL